MDTAIGALCFAAPCRPKYFYTRRPVHKKPVTPKTLTPEDFHNRMRSNKKTFTQKSSYAKLLLHQKTFYTGICLHQEPFELLYQKTLNAFLGRRCPKRRPTSSSGTRWTSASIPDPSAFGVKSLVRKKAPA